MTKPTDHHDKPVAKLTEHEAKVELAWLAMEIGLGQQRQIALLFSRVKRYEKERSWSDKNGAPRVMGARLLSVR